MVFLCDECGKDITNERQIKKRNLHTGEITYICDECFEKGNHISFDEYYTRKQGSKLGCFVVIAAIILLLYFIF